MVEGPRESKTATKKEYVVEKWWHRLLKTMKYISTLIVVIFSCILLFVIYEGQYYTYSYSFEPNYAESKGEEFNCNPYNCGGLSGKEITTKYLASTKKNDFDVLEEYVQIKPIEIGETVSELEIAEFIIQKYQIKYKRRYNLNKLISGLGIVLLIAISWYIFVLVLYKIILYIVHGHTRVRKATQNS